MWRYLRDPTFSRFDTIPECDKHTDRQTHNDGIYHASIASRGKNLVNIGPETLEFKKGVCGIFSQTQLKFDDRPTSGTLAF